MPSRQSLIARKAEVIRELARLRQRVAAEPGQAPALQSTIQRLQQEEYRLRLAIDRTPPSMTTQLRPLPSEKPTRFDVLILAGYDRDKPDPLTERTGQPHKVLTPVAGQPMIWHTVQALRESGVANEILIVGLSPEEAPDFGVPVHFYPDHGSLFANQNAGALALAQLQAQDRFILVTTGDVPLLTGEMLRWFVQACAPYEYEGYWGVVSQEVMERTFPNSHRSYLKLAEGALCSGDLFLIQLSAGLRIQPYMDNLIGNRKNILVQLRFFGFQTILRLIFRRLSLAWMLQLVAQRMTIRGHAVQLPFAEAGMDVDKPHQLDQVLAYLERHPEHPLHQRRVA
jgi:molybdopterin-guanine dinucleotide biosynthesis protein A